MSLHVLYRSYGGENNKDRPGWYSKDVALLSFARSLGAVADAHRPVDVHFVNDGPVDPRLLAVMQELGSVLTIGSGSNRGSFRHAISFATTSGWYDADLAYFAEDDYLYAEGALPLLAELASTGPPDYAALYGNAADTARPGAAGELTSPWVVGTSTTSTFSARLGALRRDRWLHQVAPYSGGGWDHASCLAYQGIRPFPVRTLTSDLVRPEDAPGRRVVKAVGKTLGRVALDVLAARRAGSSHSLVVASPNVATHMELSELAVGHDWAGEAAAVLRWGREQSGALRALAPDQPAASGQAGSK